MPALAVRLLGMLIIAAVAALLTVALAAAFVARAVAAFAATGLAVPLLLARAAMMLLLRRPLGRARLRALAGGGDRHPDQLLDVAQEGTLLAIAERDGDAVGAGARGAADAVHVALRDRSAGRS